MSARSFQTIVAQTGPALYEAVAPECQPPHTVERDAACAAYSYNKALLARQERADTFVGKYVQPFVQAVGSFLLPGSGIVSGVATAAQEAELAAQQQRAKQSVVQQLALRSTPMAFSDGDTGFGFSDFFSGLGKTLQGPLGQNLLGVGTQALSGYVQQQFAPQRVSFPLQTSMAAVPSIVRGGAMVARGFFNRFPSLAVGIQALRAKGATVTRSSLYSLMKRFGPDFLIGGGILTAAAVSELAMAGPGRRRMNAGNVKALRRAHRRMKAFHNVCRTNDTLLGGRRKTSKRGHTGGTTITQVK